MSTKVMSGVDEVVTNWCQSCEDLRQEVEKLKAEHALNYKALKEKIISTDKLIKRYTAKCQEFDSQTKKLEETSEVLQNYKSDCENFESQLKTALEELAPLKENNQKYEKLCAQLEKKLGKYEVKLQAAESSQIQYSVAQKQLEINNDRLKEDKSSLEKRIKDMEISAKKTDATLQKLQDELDAKKKEMATLRKENTSYKTKAGKLKMRSECWTELLRTHGLLREGRQMYKQWRKDKKTSFKLKMNSSLESEDEDSEEEFADEVKDASAPSGDRDAGVMRQDSLVEMILAEMIVLEDDDPEPLDFSYLMPISPAVSPLRQSPSSEDEGPMLTSDEDLTDAAEQLERSVLKNKTKKTPGRKGSGKGKKSRKGKLKVVESAFGPQGVLEIQESLSDKEDEVEADVPFTRIGVKTRSNSRSQDDDGVFKEPLPVSPLRSRKRRGSSMSSLDSKSPLLTTRVTRSSSFPITTSPQRVPPISSVIPIKIDPCPNVMSEKKKDIEAKIEQNDTQPADKSERGQRVLRKRKGSANLSDSDSEDLTISRRSLRSSSTSSDEGSGEETSRSQRRSPRLGGTRSKVMSPQARLTRSRRTTEESGVSLSSGNMQNDPQDIKSTEQPSKESHNTSESKYRGFVKGGMLIPGGTVSTQELNSDRSGKEREQFKRSQKGTDNFDGAFMKKESNSVISESLLHDHTIEKESTDANSEKTEMANNSESENVQTDKGLMLENINEGRVNSKVLRRQDSIHSEISSRGSNSVCDMDGLTENDDENEGTDDKESKTAEHSAMESSGKNENGCSEPNESQVDCKNCDNEPRDLQEEFSESNKQDNKGATSNSINTSGQSNASSGAVSNNQHILREDGSQHNQALLDVNDNVHENDISDDKSEVGKSVDDKDKETVKNQGNEITSESHLSGFSQQGDDESVDKGRETVQGRSETLPPSVDSQVKTSPSTSTATLTKSETSIIKGLRCKVVTDSSPAFTRLVNQGSTGFVPICTGDLLSPVTPFSPNVMPPPSLLRPESNDPTSAESKSSDGSAELQGLMNHSEGDQSVSPRESGNSAEVKFYINVGEHNIVGEGENAAEREDDNREEAEDKCEGSPGDLQDNEEVDEGDAESADGDRSNEGNMDMDDMSDQQSVLSSLPPSEAGDDERISPVSSLSTSGSSRSIPLSPLPLSDTESLCDPISPLPPTPERQLLRTPTPIDGTRISPRPSCSNQPCTPPTPNTPPHATVKERNPVKFLAIKNLQRQLSAEGQEDKGEQGVDGKIVNGGKGRLKKRVKGQGQTKQTKGQGRVKGQSTVLAEGGKQVKGQNTPKQTDQQSQNSETVNERSDVGNNHDPHQDANHAEDGISAADGVKDEIKRDETNGPQPIRIARGRRISRIPSDPSKNCKQEKVTGPGVTAKRKGTLPIVDVAPTDVKKEETTDIASDMELPVQTRTFKRRVSRFGKRQTSSDKSVSESGQLTQEVMSEERVPQPAEQPDVKSESNQPEPDNSQSSQVVAMEMKRAGRPAKRKALDGESQKEVVTKDTEHPFGSTAESTKKPRPSEFKAIDCELQYLIRLKAVNHKIVADRLTNLGCSSDLLIQQMLEVLENKGTDLLKILFMEIKKVKDTWLRSTWKPIMADHEVKMMQLILQMNSTVMPTIADDFIKAAGKYIKTNKNVLISVSLSRLMAGLVRQFGDWQRLRVLVYDLLIGGTNGYPSVLVGMAGVWPDPIAKLDVRQSPNIVLDTIEFTVMSKLSMQRVKHSKIVQCLQNLLGWSEASLSMMSMSQNLVSKLMSAESCSEDLLACRLLLVGQPWEWINNELILGILWPRLQSWVSGQNQEMVTDQSLQNLLSLLGEAASKCPPHFSHSIEGVMKTLSALASGVPNVKVSESVQQTCLEALLQLSPFDPMMVSVICINWVRSHRHDYLANPALQHKIKHFTEFYKTRLQAIDLTVFNV